MAPAAGGTDADSPPLAPRGIEETGVWGWWMGALQVEELVVGSGLAATAGKQVKVHYTGWLTDGSKFDSSRDRGQPFAFRLGAGMVIRGWDEGVAGMQVGGKRRLTVPPEMAYGKRGFPGAIPPDATLVFEVELLGVS